MELELQLIDPKTFNLVDGILPLMACYPPYPWIKPEYNQATVEIMSKVCTTIQDLEMHMHAVLSTLQQRCQGLGMTLCSAGTHPFCSRSATMMPIPRHLVEYQMAGFLANWTTFALHVHVGMPSGDEAVTVMGKLKPYLPILLALSANSPLWWDCDTSYASFSQRLLATRKAYGLPPTFESWQAFDNYFTVARHAKMFEMVRDIHWDLRLQPELGTLEVRVMDAPTTLKEALMLAAFVHTLVMNLSH